MIPTRKPVKKSDSRPSVKASFYLTREVLASLEEARLKLREMARPEGKAKITKSLIVEVAIQLAIEELETSGRKARLPVCWHGNNMDRVEAQVVCFRG